MAQIIHFLCFTNFIFYTRPIIIFPVRREQKKRKKKREKRERYKNPKLMHMFETLKSKNSFLSLSLSLFYVVFLSLDERVLQFGAIERDEGRRRRRREGRIARARVGSREGKRDDLYFVSVGVNSTRRDRAFASGGRRP